MKPPREPAPIPAGTTLVKEEHSRRLLRTFGGLYILQQEIARGEWVWVSQSRDEAAMRRRMNPPPEPATKAVKT